MTLPGALNITLTDMFGKRWRDELGEERKKKVVVANDEHLEMEAVALVRALGYSNVVFLKGGLDEFKRTIIDVPAPAGDFSAAEHDAYRFRSNASVRIAALIKEQLAGPKKAPKAVKRIVGGCGA